MFCINVPLVRRLISTQFPDWKNLPIEPIALSGWDNKTFRLGSDMLVRMPSGEKYAAQVEKEQKWLPKLAPFLPFPIPEPLAMGRPSNEYPWKWSIYRYLIGDCAASVPPSDLCLFAKNLGQFLFRLEKIDSLGGPIPGADNFYRGGSLKIYDQETRNAILALKGKIDSEAAIKIWETAIATSWMYPPVWVHGDISLGNLLVQDGKLCAVIDFGQLAVGDPACDLAIAWTFFHGKSREIFLSTLSLDSATYSRGKGWTLWKALINATSHQSPNNTESSKCWKIINDLINDPVYN